MWSSDLLALILVPQVCFHLLAGPIKAADLGIQGCLMRINVVAVQLQSAHLLAQRVVRLQRSHTNSRHQ